MYPQEAERREPQIPPRCFSDSLFVRSFLHQRIWVSHSPHCPGSGSHRCFKSYRLDLLGVSCYFQTLKLQTSIFACVCVVKHTPLHTHIYIYIYIVNTVIACFQFEGDKHCLLRTLRSSRKEAGAPAGLSTSCSPLPEVSHLPHSYPEAVTASARGARAQGFQYHF